MTESATRPNRNKSNKMLVTASPVILPMVSPGLSSPVVEEFQDGDTNKLIAYLHRLAGNHEVEADIIMKDHNYARSWNWKPESVFVRPAKKIFFSKPQNVVKEKDDDLIDVEKMEEDPAMPPFDLSKIHQTMDEFQRVSNFIRTEDVEDWEEKIDKILWSPVQNRIFNRVMRILNQERVARLTKEKSSHEPILRRTSIDSTARKFRETLASAHWDWRITQWLHSLLFDHLPQDYLTIYLDVLQSLRQKIPQLIDKMINVQPNITSKSNAVTWETLGPLLKKSWDPVTPMLNAYKPQKLPHNPILIVVHNGMSSSVTSRQHKWVTQLGMLGMVVTITTNFGLNANRMTVLNSLEQIVQAARTKIQDLKVNHPNRPIILIGFNTGAAIACQVGLSEHVAAIVCLGFPHNTVDGKRGSSDDLMLDLRCPVLFVIGEHATLSRVDEIEGMRERMLVPTSLVVVGSADDQLRISTSKKITERLSQSIVDRCVLDEIGDFLGGVLTQPDPVPVRIINSHVNTDNKNKRTNDARKRKNSTSSCSQDSEPQSPFLKKARPHSPSLVANAINNSHNNNNNLTRISANPFPRGALLTLTGTTATQTPKPRRPRVNFPNQQAAQRLAAQKAGNSMGGGGITLNIGSLASLAPVGPLRFDSAPINLQISPAAASKAVGGTIKTSANTYIKVPKGSHQVNVAGGTGQNVGKIKMLMPTRKATTQRSPANHRNVGATEKTGEVVGLANVHLPSNVPARVGTQTATTPNAKACTESASSLSTPTNVQQSSANTGPVKSPVNATNVVITPKNATVTAAATTAAASATSSSSIAPTKVAENSGCRRQVQISGSAKARSTQTSRAKISSGAANSATTSSPSHQQIKSSLSLNHLAKQAPHTPVQSMTNQTTTNKSAAKKSSESIDTSHQQQHRISKSSTSRTHQLNQNVLTSIDSDPVISLDDGLDILDIPIIIAKDGENLNNLGCTLSPLPASTVQQTEPRPSLPPPLQVCSNKVFFINSSRVQPTLIQPQSSGTNRVAPSNPVAAQTQIKYTKIILTKRSDAEEKKNTSGQVVVTKNNATAHAGKLLFVEQSKTDGKNVNR